ncbi:NADP-dependent oxidoreductase domain-containing protein [Durotheca rogersii]|uniref:NADP-dependent oxidoreductase domain-containing protein n=1 Tax=Durotheca rogersii TaxID=419775 RepID=UPI00221EA3B4|nr:NADP-dependent oxidoreductase domain-containing protein [Durotheca rogersii]KAI5865614.1 NADP-dependent oxidoreductase domain-containing protein [Durotheca rogersii]
MSSTTASEPTPTALPINQRTFTLNNGVKMPAVGFGTFSNGGVEGETYRAVTCALEVGYRHLDCAWFYENEEEVGAAVRDFLARAGGAVRREDLFICTKVWNHLHEPDEVRWSLECSLRHLGLAYVDLFLVHWPVAVESDARRQPRRGPDGRYVLKPGLTADPEPTWRAMEALYAEGRARAIGVSNWTVGGLAALLARARVPPAVNQVEIHPFLPNGELVAFCRARGVVRTDPALNAVARRAGRDLAQVLLAWGVRRGYAVLPKSATPARIASNFDVPALSDADFDAVEAVARGRHVRFVNMKDTFGYDVWPEEAAAEAPRDAQDGNSSAVAVA